MLKNGFKKVYNSYNSWKYLRKLLYMSKKNGFMDVNDYIDKCADNMAQKATKRLFQEYNLKLNSGAILEVGAGTGRFTREIKKYVPENVKIKCLEIDIPKFYFLKKYIKIKKMGNVTAVLEDYFDYASKNESFEMVIIPWFIPMNLYKWARVVEVGSIITKPYGYFIFECMDSRDSLIEVITNADNSLYNLINGNDIEKIANYFGFKKKLEFNQRFNTQIGKYHIYQKMEEKIGVIK